MLHGFKRRKKTPLPLPRGDGRRCRGGAQHLHGGSTHRFSRPEIGENFCVRRLSGQTRTGRTFTPATA